jgi:exonuclease SbcC
MKPLQLALQAFGPFATRQQIDFTNFGDNPLFLINGPTGAGKSSILDAICFALYGETTDVQRDAAAMRCDQAEPNLLTEVTLDFRLGENHYRVKRIPRQWRPKSRGEGETEEMAAATLWRIEDDCSETLLVSKKVKQVNDEIERLTGLKVDQFRQVMVLPQGKFRELLLADSRKREEIFSQLFQTSIYKRIEERLKQQSADIRKNVEAHRHHIKGLLDAAEVTSQEELEQQQQALAAPLQKQVMQKDQAHVHFQQALQRRDAAQQLIEQFSQLEQTRQQLDTVQAKQPQIDAQQSQLDRAMQAARIAPLFEKQLELGKNLKMQTQNIEQTKSDLEQLQQQAQLAEQALESARESFVAVDGLKIELQKILQIQHKLDELQKAELQAQQANAQQQQSQQQFNARQRQLDSVHSELQNKLQLRETLQQQVAELGRSELTLMTLKTRWDQRQKLAQTENSLQQKHDDLKLAQSRLQQQTESTETARKNARQVELAWHASQAQILARELQVDQPCPVCGSTEHPAPAHVKPQQTIVERAEVDAARANAERQSVLQQQAQQQKNRVELELKQLEDAQHDMQRQLGDTAQLAMSQLQQDLDDAERASETLMQKRQQLDGLQLPLNNLQQQIEQQQKRVESLRAELQQVSKLAVQQQSTVEHLAGDIPEAYRAPDNLLAAQEKLQAEIERLTQGLQHAEHNHQNLQRRLSGLQATLTQQQKQREQVQVDFELALENWQEVLQRSDFLHEQDFQQAMLTEQQQQALSSQLQDYHDQLKTLQGSLAQQKKMLKGKTLPELENLEQRCAQAEEFFKQAEHAWRELEDRANTLKKLARKIKTEADKNAKLEQQYAIYGTLSDVASGRRNHKISLQRFVLSVLLDDVLLQASQRLSVMSGGRYQLLRRDERSKGNAPSGLELDVEDAYTGKTRSVATLSGGESFMAALSLALGLSDVVQAYAGGIRLDMLFIDEGFGSLDQESLDLAMRTLIDLQSSGRMIGIISHVAELKEQMALRLDVLAGRKGSTVKMIV